MRSTELPGFAKLFIEREVYRSWYPDGFPETNHHSNFLPKINIFAIFAISTFATLAFIYCREVFNISLLKFPLRQNDLLSLILRSDHFMIWGSTGICGTLTKMASFHFGTQSVWYLLKLLKIALLLYMQVTRVQRVGKSQIFCFVDELSSLCYSILLRRTALKSSYVLFPKNLTQKNKGCDSFKVDYYKKGNGSVSSFILLFLWAPVSNFESRLDGANLINWLCGNFHTNPTCYYVKCIFLEVHD